MIVVITRDETCLTFLIRSNIRLCQDDSNPQSEAISVFVTTLVFVTKCTTREVHGKIHRVPFNDRAGQYIGRHVFGHNSPATASREVVKPSTDSARLLVPSQKLFQFWVWGSLGGTLQVKVF